MGEPRSWGEFTEELVRLIGQEADTGGSPTEGTLAAKGNAILEVLKNGGMPIVKSIQRGAASQNTSKGAVTININKVDVDKSIIFLQGGASTIGWYSPVKIDRFLPESFTVSAMPDSNRHYTMVFSWVVVEFY